MEIKRKDLNKPVFDGYMHHRYLEDFKRCHPHIYEVINWGMIAVIFSLAIIGIYHLAGIHVGAW